MYPHFLEYVIDNSSAELYFYENGKETRGRRVLSPDAMIGLTLLLPRALGATGVRATLLSAGGEALLSLSLSLFEWEGDREAWAAILDALPPDAIPFASLSLTVECPPFLLHLRRRECGGYSFVKSEGEADTVPLVFLAAREESPPLAGGSLVCLPLYTAEKMDEAARRDLLFTLSSIGAHGVYLCPAPREGAHGVGELPSIPHPCAFVREAREAGLTVLGDFLLLLGITEHPDLLFGGFCSPSASSAPIEEEPRPAFFSAPLASRTQVDVPLSSLVEKDGVIAAALSLGYGGLVVRAADCFGDAFLSALRHLLNEEGKGLLLGGTMACGTEISFGTRRRFFLGDELDAPISYALRFALLDFFLEKNEKPLADYFVHTLACMPSCSLSCMPNLLSDGALGLFPDALPVDGEEKVAYAELAYLVAATLPGVPAYYAMEIEAALPVLRRLALLRRREGVYASGSLRLLHLSPTLLVFAREGKGECLVTVINASREPLAISSPDEFFAVYGGRGRKRRLLVRPFGGAVLKSTLWTGESCRLYFSHT